MTKIKELMIDAIAKQPDDSSFEEILRELAYLRMIEKGLEDSDDGRVISNDLVAERIESWQK